MLRKISKTIVALQKFQGILPRTCLLTIYKPFARLHLDYDDVTYDQTFNESFDQSLESIQCNAVIAIADAIGGTLSENFYQEIGLEPPRTKR